MFKMLKSIWSSIVTYLSRDRLWWFLVFMFSITFYSLSLQVILNAASWYIGIIAVILCAIAGVNMTYSLSKLLTY